MKEGICELGRQQTSSPFAVFCEFDLVVPSDYCHERALHFFQERNREEFGSYDSCLSDENFSGVSYHLIPGNAYRARIYSIASKVTSEMCLEFLLGEGSFLAGAQGLSVAWLLKKEKFPNGKWVASFDKKEALWKDRERDHRVPMMQRNDRGVSRVGLGIFEHFVGWLPIDSLIGFSCLSDGTREANEIIQVDLRLH